MSADFGEELGCTLPTSLQRSVGHALFRVLGGRILAVGHEHTRIVAQSVEVAGLKRQGALVEPVRRALPAALLRRAVLVARVPLLQRLLLVRRQTDWRTTITACAQ